MKKILFMFVGAHLCLTAIAQSKNSENTRQLWLDYMDKVARPVMENIAHNTLKANMPVVLSNGIDNKESRSKVAYLEAFARTISGIAPWMQLEGGSLAEVKLRNQYRQWALQGIANAVNPEAKDYLKWDGGQPLVDASYVALTLIRCPWLWEHMDKRIQNQVVAVLKITRATLPVYTNWLLFSGMIEAFFCKYHLDYDPMRLDYGIKEFTQHWYVGDGMYSDGMEFHVDYYNSIVIQPNLSTILDVVFEDHNAYSDQIGKVKSIGQRYSQILERLINADGSYPATGRSIVYRCGVFHHLANIAFKKQLPESLSPSQVREALTAVIKKTLGAPGTFSRAGWLNIGLCGSQPGLADFYITTGSLYICANVFLPLGLPETDEFWNAPAKPWTAVKIWSGQDVQADHALDFRK